MTPTPAEAAPRIRRDTRTLADAHWPSGLPTATVDAPCAQLDAAHGVSPTVHLAVPGETSDAGDVPAGEKDPTVQAGRAAYVLSGGFDDTDHGSPFLIDAKGRADPLVGDDVADLLGYGSYPVAVVPDTWVELFACGVNLSRDAALSPPTEGDGRACS